MRYIPNNESARKKMLDQMGVDSIDALFSPIPEEVRLNAPLNIDAPKSEHTLLKSLKRMAKETTSEEISFLGAGCYQRFIPSAVVPIASRAEFMTSYTPYQPEISQGTLQVMFEFQTLLGQVTGMDVANASMYEAASATAEAVLMAGRIHRKGKKVLISAGLHPEYRETVQTYLSHMDLEIEEIPLNGRGETDLKVLAEKIDPETLCCVTQMVNFYGVIEPMQELGDLMESAKALNIAVLADMSALGMLTPPGELKVDIFTGEGQSLGLPASYGGPNLGIFACQQKYVRQMPGRLAGKSVDKNGKTAFCLTLATREQHIRREKATSNICTNQMLCGLMISIYLSLLGKSGFRQLAKQNYSKTQYALKQLNSIGTLRLRYDAPVYNEFVLDLPIESDQFLQKMKSRGILAGVPLNRFDEREKKSLLINITEIHSKEEIDCLVEALKEVAMGKFEKKSNKSESTMEVC